MNANSEGLFEKDVLHYKCGFGVTGFIEQLSHSIGNNTGKYKRNFQITNETGYLYRAI